MKIFSRCVAGGNGAWPVAVLVALLLGGGCSTFDSPGSASHAGLTIKGHAYADTVLMTRRVFTEQGFKLAKVEENRMIFEQDGSRMDQAKFGGWGRGTVTLRAKLDVEELGTDAQYLRMDVYSVHDAGNMMEDETKVMMLSARRYQQLLVEIQERLDGTWVPPEQKKASK